MASPKPNPVSIEQHSLQLGKWANLLMCGAGIVAAFTSRSDSLLVDGLYSGVNFVSSIIAARISTSIQQPADRWYPFGYDAYEALYVKYRSLVLLGIIALAGFGAGSKIATYLSGGDVPDLVFGPILIYTIVMIISCFGLAAWHHTNWTKAGRQSEMLRTERDAAFVDGVISAGAGGALMGSMFLEGTAIQGLVPISDSIVVLVLCGFVVRQPVAVFFRSLREVAGGAADPDLVDKAQLLTENLAANLPVTVLAVPVTKLGRTYFVVPYIKPDGPVRAEDIDAFREEIDAAYRQHLGSVRTEVIVTAIPPY